MFTPFFVKPINKKTLMIVHYTLIKILTILVILQKLISDNHNAVNQSKEKKKFYIALHEQKFVKRRRHHNLTGRHLKRSGMQNKNLTKFFKKMIRDQTNQ
jgi:hypothetical protein